jgi:Cu/Ag efflux protein CusF
LLRLIATITLAPLLITACKKEPRDLAPGTLHSGVGVVVSIDSETEMIQIDHEEIANYMPAMNMPFKVEKTELLKRVHPGDKVQFSIKSTDVGMIITDISHRE